MRILFQSLRVYLVRLHGISSKRKVSSSPTYRAVILFPSNNGLLLVDLQREMNYQKEDGKTETGECGRLVAASSLRRIEVTVFETSFEDPFIDENVRIGDVRKQNVPLCSTYLSTVFAHGPLSLCKIIMIQLIIHKEMLTVFLSESALENRHRIRNAHYLRMKRRFFQQH